MKNEYSNLYTFDVRIWSRFDTPEEIKTLGVISQKVRANGVKVQKWS